MNFISLTVASSSVLPRRRSQAPRTRGIMLLELSVAMTVTAALMIVGVGLLNTMLRVDQEVREHQRRSNDLTRLAEHFRADVHASTRVKRDNLADSNAIIELHCMESTVITYHRDKDRGLVRTVSEQEKIIESEAFSLPSDCEVTIQADPKSEPADLEPSSLGLRLAFQATAGSAPRSTVQRVRHISATLGRHHRFDAAPVNKPSPDNKPAPAASAGDDQ